MKQTQERARVKGEYLILGVILLVALGLRLAWVFYCDTVPVFDFLKYHLGAVSLARGEGYKLFGAYTAFEPIGFSFYLSVIYRVFGENLLAPKLLNVFLGVDTVFLVYLLGKRWFRPEAGLLAAFFLALSPRQIVYSSVLSTEILFTYFLLLMLLVVSIRTRELIKPLVLGLLGAVLAYIKPFFLVFPGLVFLLLLMQHRHEDREESFQELKYRREIEVEKHRAFGIYEDPTRARRIPGFFLAAAESLGWAFLIGFVMLAAILPWSLRNYQVFEELIPISTNGGITLYLNNNDYAQGHWQDPFQIPGSPIAGMRDEKTGFWDELEVNRVAGEAGKRWIMDNPERFLKLGFLKNYQVYKDASDVQFAIDYTSSGGALPNRNWVYRTSDWAHKLLLGGLAFYLVVALINLVRKRDGLLGQGSIFITWLMFTATFFVFEGQPRYIFPLVPLFTLLIAWSLVWLASRVREALGEEEG